MHAYRHAARARVDVVARQRALAPLVELAFRRQGQRVRRNDNTLIEYGAQPLRHGHQKFPFRFSKCVGLFRLAPPRMIQSAISSHLAQRNRGSESRWPRWPLSGVALRRWPVRDPSGTKVLPRAVHSPARGLRSRPRRARGVLDRQQRHRVGVALPDRVQRAHGHVHRLAAIPVAPRPPARRSAARRRSSAGSGSWECPSPPRSMMRSWPTALMAYSLPDAIHPSPAIRRARRQAVYIACGKGRDRLGKLLAHQRRKPRVHRPGQGGLARGSNFMPVITRHSAPGVIPPPARDQQVATDRLHAHRLSDARGRVAEAGRRQDPPQTAASSAARRIRAIVGPIFPPAPRKRISPQFPSSR